MTLGETVYVSVIALAEIDARFLDNPHIIRAGLEKIAQVLGMKTNGPPAWWFYPTSDGQGGHGVQALQPIVTSGIRLNTYRLGCQTAALLIIESCKAYDPWELERAVSALMRPREMTASHQVFDLKRGKEASAYGARREGR